MEIIGDLWIVLTVGNAVLALCFAALAFAIVVQRPLAPADLPVLLTRPELLMIVAGIALVMALDFWTLFFTAALIPEAFARLALASLMVVQTARVYARRFLF